MTPDSASETQEFRSLQSVVNDLAQLSTNIAQDRAINIYSSKNVILSAHVVGEGFIDNPNRPHYNEDIVEDAAEDGEHEQSLFVGNDEEDVVLRKAGDSAYVDRGLPKEEDDDLTDDEGKEVFGKDAYIECIKFLNSLKPQIESLHQARTTPSTCPHLAVEPKPHQWTALAKIEHNRDTRIKATLIADPMGLGKTLPAMMAVVKAKADAKRFSIVVATSSCISQWKEEFEKFFVQDAVRIYVLRDPNTSPLELLKYDVILVSYSFVMNQYRKLCKYLNNVAQAKRGIVDIKRFERPNVSLFSEILDSQEGVQSPYLVLDEVTAVKNSKSITFAAIEELRKLAHTCVMLTGSPVDNTWFDLFAYVLLLLGHNIRSRPAMLAVFASENEAGKRGPPKGNQMRRLLQLLNSFVVRRPENTITIPALHQQTVSFKLSPSEASDSNYHYNKYMQIVNMKSSKDTVRTLNTDKLLPWRHLTQAMQYACHPSMVLIMHLVRNPMREDNDRESADVLYEAEDIGEWIAWRENLKIDNNWKSSRITAIIDVFNKVRDLDPSSSVIIFDESVYFLDIVEIAFSNMYEPVECLRYDGRTVAEKRSTILQAFADATSPKVLLASRAAGGVGLNITTANIVILCGPWWKIEWEQQAIKRAHRPGQTREVLAFRMMALNCSLDIYKAAVRDKKHRHNLKIITQITRQDGIVPTAWNNLED